MSAPWEYGENRYAWVRTQDSQFVILVGNESGEAGEDVILFIPRPGKQPNLSIHLTSMTTEELQAVSDILTAALEWAKPVVALRDQEAQDEWDKGNDAVGRIYRAVPQLVFRKKPSGEYGQGVHVGPERVPESSGGVVRSDGGVRGSGDDLVELNEGEPVAEDDRSQVD